MIELQKRLRMGIKALVDLLGFSMARLKAETLDKEVVQALEAMANAQPEPLRAVADLAERQAIRLREGLQKDAETFTKRHLAAKRSLAQMPQKHEEAMAELNAFRLHMAQEQPLPRYAKVSDWEAAYPVEQKLLKAVDANDAQAQAAKARMAAMLESAIEHLHQRLAHYEAQHGKLPGMHKLLADYTQELEALEWALLESEEAREQLVKAAPLVLAADAQSLSLASLFPAEAQAQAVAEEAIAGAKEKAKALDRETRRKERKLEGQQLKVQYKATLVKVQAGEQPQVADLPAEALRLRPAAHPVAEAAPVHSSALGATGQASPTPLTAEASPESSAQSTTSSPASSPAPSPENKAPESPAPSPNIPAAPAPVPVAASPESPAPEATEALSEIASAHDIPLVALPKGLDMSTLTYSYRPPGWVAADETMYQQYKRTALNGQNPPLALLPELTLDLMRQRRKAEEEDRASKKRLNQGVNVKALAAIYKARR